MTSVIACENTLPGDPESDWQINGQGDTSIQGYATSESVNVGQTVSFKIKTPSTNYHIDILRMGYYAGNGARKVVSGLRPTATLPQSQPACLVDKTTGLIDCGNWAVSASWSVPTTAVSGVYVAHLVRDDTTGSNGSQIVFVVRNDGSHSDILVQTSDETWAAYNDYGGNSLYTCDATVACPAGSPEAYKGAWKVSYNRPDDWASDNGRANPYYAEYPMIRYLEANGYDVSYTSASDVDASGSALLGHKMFLSSGHDEYWSKGQRSNVQAALNGGVNLAFFSGNEMFWKTRWESSTDGSKAPYRTLVCYKETHFNAPTDPQDPTTWTGTWQDPRFSPPADGGLPPNALTGQNFIVNAGTTDIAVPSQFSALRFWRGTAAASLSAGQTLTLGNGAGTLGYEWDDDPDNGFRPTGLIDMSTTSVSGAQTFTDYGSELNMSGTATHHLTLYRASSGALVFGAGTVQWAWGLDSDNQSGKPADTNMRQATVNLFADMSVQPATLASGLKAASASTDLTPPTSVIAAPANGTTVSDGTKVTVSGTAQDAGGGVVAGVEVSTDGGSTWHPASLTTPAASSVSWSFAWVAHGYPRTTIESRATDDSGNVELAPRASTLNVTCPCSLWGTSLVAPPDSGDLGSVEVGMQFRSDTFGTVNGVRFYKVTANTGTHVGSLWSSTGQLLAQATFSGESASGWQQVNFSSPVPINANTTYVVSYHAPSGHYAATSGYFYPAPSPPPDGGGTVDVGPLHALLSMGSTANGVYDYGGAPVFPSSTYKAGNYWVDPVFAPSPPPGQATNVVATAGAASAAISWTAPSSGGPATTYTVTPYIGATAQAPTTVTGNPAPTTAVVNGLANGTTYTFTVTASNPNGSGPPSAASAAVTPLASYVSYVQGKSAHAANLASLSVTPNVNLTAGNRLIVVAGVWNGKGATASAVADAAGDTFTELTHFTASDGTEESVWTAPITSGGGKTPAVTVTPTAAADVGASVSEYSGLSTASGAAVLDKVATATGTTGATATAVSSGATPATTAGNELAIGAYVDSGFGGTLSTGSAWIGRTNVSGASDIDLLTEDQLLTGAGATPNASVSTSAQTTWLLATIVLKGAAAGATVPGAPTGVTATAGNAQATVSWTAPADGGASITSYTVTPYAGGVAQTSTTVTGSPPLTKATVTGLTNGTSYTFTVTATNSVGTGPSSAASSPVTPSAPTVPGTPTNVAATAGNGQATVSWTAPPNGGSVITSYTVTPYVGTTAQTATTVTGSPPATTTVVGGLTNGTAYTFTVVANNAVGASAPSNPSSPVTPTAPMPPGAPTSVTATPSSGSATVNWTAPADGGSTITSYTVTPYIGTTAQPTTTVSGSPAATHATVTGLTNGSTYTFTVTATNSIGSGPASSASNAVTPAAPPGQPTNVIAQPGNGQATVTWAAPSNGGSAITSYTVTPYIGTAAQTPTTISGSPPSAVATVLGLTNGVSYTFTVTAANAIGSGPPSAASAAVTPAGPPAAPTNVVATAGNGQATVTWTAPANNGSTISSYTVTPYVGTTAQPATSVTGSPPATTATVAGLTNGTAYTFTVTAANAVGSGPASAASAGVTPSATPTPAFVQQVSAHATNVASLSVTPGATITAGNRIVVMVGVWSSGAATASTVTDAAGNVYTEVQHFQGSDATEMSVWTAPITVGGGTRPAIKVTPTSSADVGVAAVEYAGLSTAAGSAAVDQTAQNTGTTSAASTVSSGATAAAASGNELAVGIYDDSGFGNSLTAGSGWTQRVNVSPASDMEFVLEDQLTAAGGTPNASAGTGANTVWLMSSVLFKHG